MRYAQLASRARRIKYFLHMHVHAASSERSCKNADLYRLDLAFAARMYVSSIDLNCLVFCGSFMFLFCLVFAMSLCASVYMCFVVTCWERADLLSIVCGV